MQNQATVRPDDVAVDVQVPALALGAGPGGILPKAALSWRGPVPADLRLSADVETSFGARVAARIAGFMKRPFLEL
jgi:hypothetical protein